MWLEHKKKSIAEYNNTIIYVYVTSLKGCECDLEVYPCCRQLKAGE